MFIPKNNSSEPLSLCLDLDLVSRKTFASQFVPSINQLKCLPIRNQTGLKLGMSALNWECRTRIFSTQTCQRMIRLFCFYFV